MVPNCSSTFHTTHTCKPMNYRISSWSLAHKLLASAGATALCILAISKVAFPVFGWFQSTAVANEQHAEIIMAMNFRTVKTVRNEIEDLQGKAIETKYRADINDIQKEKLIASYENKIKRLRGQETCLLSGELKCE